MRQIAGIGGSMCTMSHAECVVPLLGDSNNSILGYFASLLLALVMFGILKLFLGSRIRHDMWLPYRVVFAALLLLLLAIVAAYSVIVGC